MFSLRHKKGTVILRWLNLRVVEVGVTKEEEEEKKTKNKKKNDRGASRKEKIERNRHIASLS